VPGQPDESSIFAQQSKVHPHPGSSPNEITAVLAQKFPELVRAGGSVDPTEALVMLLDKMAELEQRLADVGKSKEGL